MNIIETNLKFNSTPTLRKSTQYIILHHRAGIGDIDGMHKQHLHQGYAGIGYHFYIRKDGSVYRGRPLNTVGAHTTNYNSASIGICFEGNFESEIMPDKQIKSGQELISYIKKIYPSVSIKKHKDLYNTVCPGRNFPFDKIIEEVNMKELTTVNDIVWELAYRGIITDNKLWLKKLKEDKNSYWLARKCVNYIINQT